MDVVLNKQAKLFYRQFETQQNKINFSQHNIYFRHMQTDLPRIVAILAPTINTVQALPQLLKTLETKTVVGLSFYMVALMMLTNFLWFFHGFYIQDNSLMISGFIAFIINAAIMLLYLRYRNSK